ncbi:MAG: dioxygenase [Burkholderiaceae bacterium]|nr:dioxygenase [Burkholderiaceae bacterium]
MPVHAMDHFTVLSDDLDATRAFYARILGLVDGPRPDLGFPGAWLYIGERAVLHIIAGRAVPSESAGVLDHMAFGGTGLRETAALLEAEGVEYLLRRQGATGPWQLFFHDPSGARVEVDFDASEAPPQRHSTG